ncbi:MAG: hypothetical protein DI538_06720 [Azospira oryzae]|nr:MAG: hypothetical protein DI538_06720 [Azospira oryzae]
MKIEVDYRLQEWAQINTTFIAKNDDIFEVRPWEVKNRFGAYFGAIFSDVAINFKSQQISSITSQEIDIGIETQKKSDERLATEITQLLIDISSTDAIDLQNWVSENPNAIPPMEIRSPRMNRFTKAFEHMFPSKKFYKIENVNGAKSVNFTEHGKVISLDNFSSGEKQIVFRGSFLLKDRKRKSGSIVFIDEPEISLHPRWQLKILSFYRKLFTSDTGVQESQLIVATHSPFIIHNDNRLNDKVIVLERSLEGDIVVKDSDVKFFNWSPEEMVKDAFKIDFNSAVPRNTVFVEGELDEAYFKRCIEIYEKTDLLFDIKWIGRTKPNGTNEFSGKSALNTLLKVFLAQDGIFSSNIILYYDNDCNKPDETHNRILVRSAPKEFQNSFFDKGIESLLLLPNDYDEEKFLTEKRGIDINGKSRMTINKRQLFEWLSSHKSAKEIFSKINQELLTLQKLFQ